MTSPNNTVAGLAEKLAACPCCGAPACISGEWQDCDGNWAIECSSCNLLSWTPEDWNRRASPAPSAGVVDDAMVEQALLAFYGTGWHMMIPSLQASTKDYMRAALTAALAGKDSDHD